MYTTTAVHTNLHIESSSTNPRRNQHLYILNPFPSPRQAWRSRSHARPFQLIWHGSAGCSSAFAGRIAARAIQHVRELHVWPWRFRQEGSLWGRFEFLGSVIGCVIGVGIYGYLCIIAKWIWWYLWLWEGEGITEEWVSWRNEWNQCNILYVMWPLLPPMKFTLSNFFIHWSWCLRNQDDVLYCRHRKEIRLVTCCFVYSGCFSNLTREVFGLRGICGCGRRHGFWTAIERLAMWDWSD